MSTLEPMTSTLYYPATVIQITPEDWELKFQDVPEAIWIGNSEAEVWHQARGALELALNCYSKRGKNYPLPSRSLTHNTRLIPFSFVVIPH